MAVQARAHIGSLHAGSNTRWQAGIQTEQSLLLEQSPRRAVRICRKNCNEKARDTELSAFLLQQHAQGSSKAQAAISMHSVPPPNSTSSHLQQKHKEGSTENRHVPELQEGRQKAMNVHIKNGPRTAGEVLQVQDNQVQAEGRIQYTEGIQTENGPQIGEEHNSIYTENQKKWHAKVK
jgi:hypothetical protein